MKHCLSLTAALLAVVPVSESRQMGCTRDGRPYLVPWPLGRLASRNAR
jgi:hypothetical protein